MRAVCAIVASLVLAGTVFADTINVPADYPTIQGAINAANNGDEIVVAPGTYTSTQDGHVVDMKGKAITLRASGTPEETIIDGENARRGIACFSGETDATVIDGFTIRNGNSIWFDYDGEGDEDLYENIGGGFLCYQNNPTITNCRISSNMSSEKGGGIACWESSPLITNCIVISNTVSGKYGDGGGIYCYGNCLPIISSCTITNNMADEDGGGIYSLGSSPHIIACSINGNSAAREGGGIQLLNSGSKIINCTIMNNTANGASGISGLSSNLTITDCTITNNSAVTYSGGINCYFGTHTIVGCTISGNSASLGGGIYCYEIKSTALIGNTLICGNTLDQIYGNWIDEDGNTIQDECPIIPVLGTCCTGNDAFCITDVQESDCLYWGGQWLGEDTSCNECPPPDQVGACCIGGSCLQTTNEYCFDGGGSYAGNNIICADADCPSNCLGDTNGDGEVSVNDILLVISQFGVTCP